MTPQGSDYKDVLRALPDGYYECDLGGRFTFANGAFCRLLGRPEAEVIGASFTSFTSPSNVARIQGCFQEIYDRRATEGKFVWEILHPDDRSRFAEGSISLMREGRKVVGYRGMVIDVSDRRRMELELEASYDELQRAKSRAEAHAEQLAAQAEELTRARNEALDATRLKSQFVANVSHEIRTPMNGILGMTDLALEHVGDDTLRDFLMTIKSSANALLTLVNDILDFSKIEAGKLQLEDIVFDLRGSIDDALRPLRLAIEERGIEFAIDIDPDVPKAVTGDPSRLRQVLVNLVGNAAKFTERGHIRVRVEERSRQGLDSVLQLSVEDTGIGIPTDAQRRVFESFAQGDGSATRRHGGTGLGLSISSQLVKMMGGSIWVQSEPGEGSTFAFTTRLRVAEDSRASEAPGTGPSRARVLVADDGSDRRASLIDALYQAGHRVERSRASADLWEMLLEARETPEPFDVVVLDASMEGAGVELARAIRDSDALGGTRVVLLSLPGQRGDGARCREAGVAGYLTEPVRGAQLVETIRRILAAAGERPTAMITRHDLRETNRRLDVLVAEDNPVNQMVIRKVLENLGHGVTIVGDGRAAVETTAAQAFDVLLMDVQMPTMDGVEATRAIRKREHDLGDPLRLPIVAVTAHAMKGDREEFLAAGMDGYVSKPFTSDELERAIFRLFPSMQEPAPRAAAGKSIDREELATQVARDADLLREIATMFLEDAPTGIAAIEAALREGDARRAGSELQKLTGTLATLAARPAAAVASRLEKKLGDGDSPGAERVLDDLRTHIEQVGRELDEMVREGSALFAETN